MHYSIFRCRLCIWIPWPNATGHCPHKPSPQICLSTEQSLLSNLFIWLSNKMHCIPQMSSVLQIPVFQRNSLIILVVCHHKSYGSLLRLFWKQQIEVETLDIGYSSSSTPASISNSFPPTVISWCLPLLPEIPFSLMLLFKFWLVSLIIPNIFMKQHSKKMKWEFILSSELFFQTIHRSCSA